MEFKAQPRTISDAFYLKRKYIIPRFQREYSWDQDELNELYDDLLDNLKYESSSLTASEYFIGSLVLVGDDDDTSNIERQVVDGQQRLMTFTIVFSVLSQIFKQIGEEKLSDLVYGYIVGEDENGASYTKVVSETPKPFFQYRIQRKDIDFTRIPHTAEEARILNAYQFFEEHLKEKTLLGELVKRFSGIELKYIDALKLFRDQILKCKVIYVTVKDFDEAYTIFEVLNAKGKDLTPVDIIKNTLFSVLNQTEPIDTAYEKWGNIRNKIFEKGNEDISTFYRHYWLSKYGMITGKKLVSDFNKRIERNVASYEAFLNNLEIAAADYAQIVAPNSLHWTQPEDRIIFETLEALEIFGVTQVRIFLLALFDARRRKAIKHSAVIQVLEYLQYFHLVFNAICSERPSGLERRYSSYARKLRSCTEKEKSAQCIRELINALQESLPPYNEFEKGFQKLYFTSTASKNKKLVQYILKKLEKYASGTDEMKPDSFSIEHILPESTKQKEAGYIGNLLPLGVQLNSDLDNKIFADKIAGYKASHYQTVVLFLERYGNEPTWTLELINHRTKELAQIMYYRNHIPEQS